MSEYGESDDHASYRILAKHCHQNSLPDALKRLFVTPFRIQMLLIHQGDIFVLQLRGHFDFA